MKNRLHLHIGFIATLLVAICLLSVSCKKDPIGDAGGYSNLGVNISTYSPATEDGLALGEAEYVVKRVRLYAFDGNVLDTMIYQSGLSNVTGLVNVLMRVKQSPNKTLYVILNEPDVVAVHTRLGMINNPNAFSLIEYEIADYVTKAYNNGANFGATDFCLPMFGKKEAVNITTTPISVGMTATRSLARVDVMVQKLSTVSSDVKITSTTKLSIKNTRAQGYIASGTSASGYLIDQTNAVTGGTTDLAAAVGVPDYSTAKRAFTFYTPERVCSDEADKLGFTLTGVDFGGTSMDFEVTIGNATGYMLDKIERNKVHKIYCTFTPKSIDVTLNILDWNDQEINGDIYGSSINVSASNVLMDWWNLGNQFSTSVTFDAAEPVSFVGYFVNNVQINTLPTWLTVDLPTFTSTTTSGTIGLTYAITGGTNATADDGLHPDVFIRLKSGDIIKNIKVVYDNGYLPASFLRNAPSFPWTTNVPSAGIHLAKRGNFIPTADSASIETSMTWSREETHVPGVHELWDLALLHGRGYHNTSIIIAFFGNDAYAANACRNIGADWLLPSYNELLTIYRLKGYLGKSYLLKEGSGPVYNKNVFWSSTEQNVAGGKDVAVPNVKCVNMTTGGLVQAAKSEPTNMINTRAITYLSGDAHTVTMVLDPATATNVTLTGAGTYKYGSTVLLSFEDNNPNIAFYQFTSSVANVSIASIAAVPNTYYFVMPDEDVTITAKFVDDTFTPTTMTGWAGGDLVIKTVNGEQQLAIGASNQSGPVFKWGSLFGLTTGNVVVFSPSEYTGSAVTNVQTAPSLENITCTGNANQNNLIAYQDPTAGIGDVCLYASRKWPQNFNNQLWRVPTKTELESIWLKKAGNPCQFGSNFGDVYFYMFGYLLYQNNGTAGYYGNGYGPRWTSVGCPAGSTASYDGYGWCTGLNLAYVVAMDTGHFYANYKWSRRCGFPVRCVVSQTTP